MNDYYDLLKSWCDKLVEYQIKEIKDKTLYGGILCPACSLIHGRIGDSVYPLTAMYDYTGDKKYLETAKLVVQWSENNVRRKNGGYFNEKAQNWQGISVFSTISFGEALIYHGKCLDDETRAEWTRILVRLADFVCDFFAPGKNITNINYHASTAAALAIAYVVTGNERYKSAAYKMAEYANDFFTKENILFGECKPIDTRILTKKGCRGIDIGYDVEESMPSLIMFAYHLKDEKLLDFYAEKFAAHFEFMLPDGAWDNSFGTRSNKWTYWGSRTADGCQSALSLIADKDPIFAEAAQRNFEMYKYCSGDGFLYGGYMYKDALEEPCLHHSFCHAKALAAMIDNGFTYKQKVVLPRDEEYGLKYFESAHLNLISIGDFRATVSDYDIVAYDGAAKTGGTITMLWNKKVGPVSVAANANYKPAEPRNMQLSRHLDVMDNTAIRIKNGRFESVNETDAVCVSEVLEESICIKATGKLKDTSMKEGGSYELEYIFTKDGVEIYALSENNGKLVVPIVCARADKIEKEERKVVLHRSGADVTVKSSSTISMPLDLNFNVVGGFETAQITIDLGAGKREAVSIQIK